MRSLNRKELRLRAGIHTKEPHVGVVTVVRPRVEVVPDVRVTMTSGEVFFNFDRVVTPSMIQIGTDFEKVIMPLD